MQAPRVVVIRVVFTSEGEDDRPTRICRRLRVRYFAAKCTGKKRACVIPTDKITHAVYYNVRARIRMRRRRNFSIGFFCFFFVAVVQWCCITARESRTLNVRVLQYFRARVVVSSRT